ncbi:N-acetylmuramoyl-L-alanine amidase [Chryseolinea lacunae]|uniref:N-acetylmuramoyl-L-alanine amidase n=1 Tax=Chryseolinea lacunae TaxID=2801331 RepID=A0ABS1L371_9BACT|nr:N-acetylmuramoyl-L-alanine amidase [Chryseolinea lacunae]MBL0745952.1 N-acetylmuramoyl-L-alanine amidase [Chryseolinea lacunae]
MNSKKMAALLLCAFMWWPASAQDLRDTTLFENAYHELAAMLEGDEPLRYERAVFVTEHAYRQDSLSYASFLNALAFQTSIIQELANKNYNYDYKKFKGDRFVIDLEDDQIVRERYRQALANWAIYSFLTDTVNLRAGAISLQHFPVVYSNDDPYGTADWRNTQVTHLLETGKGNCYAMATLFNIFSERLHSNANMATAPHHIYIQHNDPKGDLYNVELPTRSFPGTGSIMALTNATREGVVSNIAMRSLTPQQSVALCLVYLAKGYEQIFGRTADHFMLRCANKALQHDARNLNAWLLKAQVYEQRAQRRNLLTDTTYVKILSNLHQWGYRQIPDDVKELILAHTQGRAPHVPADRTPKAFNTISPAKSVVSLSGGLFDESSQNNPIVIIGRTVFDTRKKKILSIMRDDKFSSYEVDPVVFALSVDPLKQDYPWYTPYQFAGNMPIVAIDIDGLEEWIVNDGNGGKASIGGPFENQGAAQAHYSQNISVYGTTLHINAEGMITNSRRIETRQVTALERKDMKSIEAIILHRTVSTNSKSTLSSFKDKGIGTHFLVGKDGRIYQAASLNRHTVHVINNDKYKDSPTNEKSIGIEVVGMYDYDLNVWEPMTERQINAVA